MSYIDIYEPRVGWVIYMIYIRLPKNCEKFWLIVYKYYLVPFNNVSYYLYECIDIDRLKDLIDSLINLVFEISTETDKDIE